MAFGSISDLWNKWNTRGFVLISLLLQIFLTLCAPIRKKTVNRLIIFFLWLAYLMADWVAPFTIGLVTHNQGNSSTRAAEVDGALQAFWASFLLLHLGGQDTITAFSMEDNWLWRRHLLTLIFQVLAAIYVFVLLFPNDKSLVIPTMLVFLAAVIRNVERTVALYLSSLPKLRESMLTQDKYFDETFHELTEELKLPYDANSKEEEKILDESIVVKHAHIFVQIFKVFVADLMFTFQQRGISLNYFRQVSPVDALRVISVELHFMYELLHTKALVIRSKRSYILRFIAFADIVIAFILFYHWKRHHLPKLDVDITYILLSGGIALDVIAFLMLVFSDWTVGGIMRNSQKSSTLEQFLRQLVSATDNRRRPRFSTCEGEPEASVTYEVLNTPVFFQRWSETISASNLLSESLNKSPRKMHKRGISIFSDICILEPLMIEKIIFLFHQAWEKIVEGCCPRNTKEEIVMIKYTKYVSKIPFMKNLWIFIFNQVSHKSEDADDITKVKQICDARGDRFLQNNPFLLPQHCDNLLRYVTRVNYDASVIIWHLATEICYNREKPTGGNERREFSKILSDYMFYLLVNQPDVMSTVAGIAQMRAGEMLRKLRDIISSEIMNENMKDLCRRLTEESGLESPFGSQLGQGIGLAKEMEALGETKWEVISGVWVEMLTYAATHIKGEVHVRVLSKGGELLAFVWLLMIHFGCFYQPEYGIYFENWYESAPELLPRRRSNPHSESITEL